MLATRGSRYHPPQMHPSPAPRRAHRAARRVLALAVLVLTCVLPARAQPASPPSAPTRVLLLGDSHFVSGLGPPLERLLGEGGNTLVVRRGKTSSGLARPDFFDWEAEARRLVAAHRPDVVVLMMGGNDGQDLLGRGLRGKVRWRSPVWAQEYRRRMHALLSTLAAPGRQVLWLELPQVTLPHLERKVEHIRRLQREALASVASARYVETNALLRTTDGVPLRTVPGFRGRPTPLRMSDGIHLTRAGGHYFAQQLLPVLRTQLARADSSTQLTAQSPTPLPLGEGKGEGAVHPDSSL